MEEHIRFLLDKPDGGILHSDVWDVQILTIQSDNGTHHDVMLTLQGSIRNVGVRR